MMERVYVLLKRKPSLLNDIKDQIRSARSATKQTNIGRMYAITYAENLPFQVNL